MATPWGAVPNERDVVKGDAKIACIAAASIMAKVTRDEMMVEYDAEYPEYHLAESKGYASPGAHRGHSQTWTLSAAPRELLRKLSAD